MPALIDALEDDASRSTAEAALRKLGRPARAALLNAATQPAPSRERESQSSVRRRRSALGLLAGMEIARNAWPALGRLVHDNDAKVATLACEIHLHCGPAAARADAVHRLIGLLAHEDWLLRGEIEHSLVAHFDSARNVIAAYLRGSPSTGEDTANRKRTEAVLRRVLVSAESTSAKQSGRS